MDLVERPTIHAGGDKNGADIQLAVDALEACLTNRHIDVFAVVSGDSDFLPLISRLQAYNKKVVIVGMRKTTSSVVDGELQRVPGLREPRPDRRGPCPAVMGRGRGCGTWTPKTSRRPSRS